MLFKNNRRNGSHTKSAVISSITVSLLSAALIMSSGQAFAATTPRVGGSITMVPSPSGPWIDSFNPYSPSGNTGNIVGDIYEPLVEWSYNKGLDIPWLATSWRWSQGGRVLTVQLRKGVRWSNGKPFTSADVVFTLDMMKKYPAVDLNALWSYMKSVRPLGPYAFQVTLNQPNNTFLYYLTGTNIVPEFQWQHVNPVTFADPHPIGTGPYMLKSYNSQEITLTRNPHYWQAPKPYLQTVYYPAETSNDTAILGLGTGQIDWAGIFAPNLKTSFVAKNPVANHVGRVSFGLVVLEVNLHQYPLNLPVVRHAISDALNRQALSTIAEAGYTTPATLNGINSSMAAKWSTPALQHKYRAVYAPSVAKAMLLKAGFKLGSNGILTTPKGQPFNVSIVVPSGATDYVTMASQISQQLHNIGIGVTVDSTSGPNFATMLATGKFSLGIRWTAFGPNPFFTLNPLMNTNYSAPYGQPASANFGRYRNPAVQRLALNFERSFTITQQKRDLAAMGQIMAAQLPVIPLLNRVLPSEYSSSHVLGWPTKANPYWDTHAYGGPLVVLTRLYAK